MRARSTPPSSRRRTSTAPSRSRAARSGGAASAWRRRARVSPGIVTTSMLTWRPAEMDDTLLCVDVGTTNTRAWLTEGARVLVRREAPVGARDTARDGHPGALALGLRGLLADALAAPPSARPRRILAAGMISSPQGLCEVPHLAAPVGLAELAA